MLAPSDIALFGQTGSQTSQLMQACVIFRAIATLCRVGAANAARTNLTSKQKAVHLEVSKGAPFVVRYLATNGYCCVDRQPCFLLHLDEAEFRAGLAHRILDAVAVGLGTHEQDDDALERAVTGALERLGDQVGRAL